VFSVNVDVHRQVVEDLSGITDISLKQHGSLAGGPSHLGLIREINTSVSAVERVFLIITGQWLGHLRMVGRKISFFIHRQCLYGTEYLFQNIVDIHII
jgi:hypothetical protein